MIFFLGRTMTGRLICPFPLIVAQMVPHNLKTLLCKSNARVKFCGHNSLEQEVAGDESYT